MRSSPRAKTFARIALARTGLLDRVVQGMSDAAVAPRRAEIAARHIPPGRGIEIGAMHFPLLLPEGREVQYVDRLTRDQAIARYPELDAARIVEPTFVEDGFELATPGDATQDFLIANHVLEHSPNPAGTLGNWARVVRPGGVLFVTVPIAEMTFDRGRPITDPAHMMEDYEAARDDPDGLAGRSRPHYLEWVTISMRNAARDEGRELSEEDLDVAARAEALFEAGEEIHFHTFSVDSFRSFLLALPGTTGIPLRLDEAYDLEGEVVAVMTKLP